MVRRSLSARINPRVELREIVLRLDPVRDPQILLRGALLSGDRRAAASSAVEIVTEHLTPEAEAFIESMRHAFSDDDKVKAA